MDTDHNNDNKQNIVNREIHFINAPSIFLFFVLTIYMLDNNNITAKIYLTIPDTGKTYVQKQIVNIKKIFDMFILRLISLVSR